MFNNPYIYNGFTPNMSMGMGAARGINTSIPLGMNAARGMASGIPRMGMSAARGMSGGLFSRLGGAFSALRGFNWGGLINNASKTIGVINQTIPLVKQAGPMVRNMRSVMKIASLFKDETDPAVKSKSNDTSTSEDLEKNKKEITLVSDSTSENRFDDSDYSSSNSPVFFVN